MNVDGHPEGESLSAPREVGPVIDPPSPADAHGRESADPDEQDRPLPWFLPMFIGAMVMWGAFYIVETPSGTDTIWGDQRTVEALMPKADAGAGGAKVDGAAVFGAKCAACHQATGTGVPGVFPPLAGSEWVLGPEKTVVHILLHGIEGEIVVNGITYKGAMPAFKTLSDDEIAAVLTHVRSQWGNAAPAIATATVKREREATAGRSASYGGGAELKQEAGS